MGGIISSQSSASKPAITTVHNEKPEVLERMRQAIRIRHYSLRTEDAYLYPVRYGRRKK